MTNKKLGRGLQALLGGFANDEPDAASAGPSSADGAVKEVALIDLEPNPFQPRRDYNSEDLAALTQSIQAHGVLQPLLVRQRDGRYQIVAGERRFRAAQEAGLTRVPVRIVSADDQQTVEFALVENIHRSDLNPMEKAQAFQDYVGRFAMTHEELAQQLGVDRSSVTNLMRLLELPEAVQQAVRVGQISYGHARALLSLTDPANQIALCRRINAENLTVRQVEALVKETRARPGVPPRSTVAAAKPKHLAAIENQLKQRFGAKVEIRAKAKDKGAILIHFGSHDEFERLLEALRAA